MLSSAASKPVLFTWCVRQGENRVNVCVRKRPESVITSPDQIISTKKALLHFIIGRNDTTKESTRDIYAYLDSLAHPVESFLEHVTKLLRHIFHFNLHLQPPIGK